MCSRPVRDQQPVQACAGVQLSDLLYAHLSERGQEHRQAREQVLVGQAGRVALYRGKAGAVGGGRSAGPAQRDRLQPQLVMARPLGEVVAVDDRG